MQHVAYQLTDAKVHAQPTPEDHQPPDPAPRFLLQWATGSGKRKRDDSGDGDSSDKAEDEDESDGDSGSD